MYTLNLLKYFADSADENTRFTIFLRKTPKDFMPKENENFTYEVVPAKILWSQIFLPYHLLFRKDVDVFFAPAHYSPRFMRQPLVVTIHDLSYLYFKKEFLKKDLYKLTRWSHYSIMKARKIIAVSKTTKKDILRNYNIQESKVSVIYNGFTRHDKKNDDDKVIKEKYGLKKKKYFLHVGTIQPRKNLSTLITAFSEFQKSHQDFKLVLEGKKGWLYDQIFDQVKSMGLEQSVIFTGYVEDEMESIIFNNAFCSVFPSFYEGFGLPLLEAMNHDCPVISSHASSLPEIAQDAAIYFDPKDYKDLLNKMNQLYTNPSLYNKMITAGRRRVKDFSWEKCGEETLNLLKTTML